MRLVIVPPSHPARIPVESGIAEAYHRVYGANLDTFATVLVAAFSGGRPLAAAGLRLGGEPFFSEVYLDRPIETLIGAIAGEDTARERIVEICNLAAMQPGTALPFLHGLIELCRNAGFEWAFFTATTPLRRLLARAGIDAIDLAPARRERIANPHAWGTYYEHCPRVVAVYHRLSAAAKFMPPRTGSAAHA
jgi:hypothetical protein